MFLVPQESGWWNYHPTTIRSCKHKRKLIALSKPWETNGAFMKLGGPKKLLSINHTPHKKERTKK